MGIRPEMSPGDALAAAGIASEQIVAPEEEEDFPWHDSSLPIVDRLELAEGKPIERNLMAAMAQLDCGSCGYVCHSPQNPNKPTCKNAILVSPSYFSPKARIKFSKATNKMDVVE